MNLKHNILALVVGKANKCVLECSITWMIDFVLFCFVLFLHQGEENLCCLCSQLSKIFSFPWKIYHTTKKLKLQKTLHLVGHKYLLEAPPTIQCKVQKWVSTIYHKTKRHNFWHTLLFIIGLFSRLFLPSFF